MTDAPFIERRIPSKPDDETHTQIRDLILKTNDPKERATLLILLRISENLEDNTAQTHEIGDAVSGLSASVTNHVKRFDGHEQQEKVWIGQAKAAWWVLTGMLVVITAMAGIILKSHLDALATTQADVAQLRKDVDKIHERHRIEDEFQKRRGP